MVFSLKYYADTCLRKKCQPVVDIDDTVRAFVAELIETMQAANGVGLAAPQVGSNWRIFIGALGDDSEGESVVIPPKVYINPKITRVSKKKCVLNEGCLSIPGLYLDITRPVSIDIEAYDEQGQFFKLRKVRGWMARNLLHEYDHLEGILIPDHLDQSARTDIEQQLKQIDLQYHAPRVTSRDTDDLHRYFSS